MVFLDQIDNDEDKNNEDNLNKDGSANKEDSSSASIDTGNEKSASVGSSINGNTKETKI